VTTTRSTRKLKLAGAPITWGVCEVPGWGRMLAPDRVLAEMASVGLRATELGAPGFLPDDPGELRAVLDRHAMHLVGAFVPLVLHEPDAGGARAEADRVAASLASLGAGIFVAAVVMDAEWSAPRPLDGGEWRRLVDHLGEIDELVAGHGLVLALHPHVGTLVERAPEVERLLRDSDASWCLDTGHLLIGGVDPVAFARDHAERVVHVHLKDVDAALAARVRAGELTLMAATQAGLFRPLGQGDVPVAAVMAELERAGYAGWVVLEQDTAITGEEPAPGAGPVLDARASLEYLAAIGEPGR
jgi:inosose dehydratase